jgi:hypothetical protein
MSSDQLLILPSADVFLFSNLTSSFEPSSARFSRCLRCLNPGALPLYLHAASIFASIHYQMVTLARMYQSALADSCNELAYRKLRSERRSYWTPQREGMRVSCTE